MHAPPPQEKICPNCGFAATANFCAYCGQKNHIPHETFWGLLSHFLSHLLDYESKSWQTIKMLWLKPGALTVAYWQQQRARYVAPVSLYIFISSFFFLVAFISPRGLADSLELNFTFGQGNKLTDKEMAQELSQIEPVKSESIGNYLNYKALKFNLDHPDPSKYIQEQFVQSFVKIMFFMIPIMALLLKVFFVRRKSWFFADHAVFSLHYHSFWFSAMLLYYLNPFPAASENLFYLLILLTILYLFLALRNVYRTGWLRSILYVGFIAMFYVVMLGIVGSLYVSVLVLLS